MNEKYIVIKALKKQKKERKKKDKKRPHLHCRKVFSLPNQMQARPFASIFRIFLNRTFPNFICDQHSENVKSNHMRST